MGRGCVKADEGESEDLAVGDQAGLGQENVPDLADGTPSILAGELSRVHR